MSEFSQWAERQLELAGYRPAEGGFNQIIHTSVMTLCRAFGDMNFDSAPPGQKKMIIDLFTELVNHRALPVAGDTRVWVPSRQAPPGPGTIVRVMSDAFDGEQGRLLNGREAVVAGARRGDFIIEFSDGHEPTGTRLFAGQLETRIG